MGNRLTETLKKLAEFARLKGEEEPVPQAPTGCPEPDPDGGCQPDVNTGGRQVRRKRHSEEPGQ